MTRARRTDRAAPRARPARPRVLDGRHARTARTRAAILDGLLGLLRAGTINPTAAEIAAAAQVSLRSIGQHFPTRIALFAAAAARHQERPEPELPAASAPIARRLPAFVAARARDLEATRFVRASAAQFAADYPVVAAAIAGNAATRRAQLERVFPGELAALDDDGRELLDVALGGRMWDALRERGSSVARCEALLVRAARALLA